MVARWYNLFGYTLGTIAFERYEYIEKRIKWYVQEVQKELVQDGFLKEQEQEITTEGTLHIDSILHIQSYATERNKLAYIKDSLQINEIEFTIEPIRDYIYKNVEMDKPSIH